MRPLLIADLDLYVGEATSLTPATPRVVRVRLRCKPQTIASPILDDADKYEADFLITPLDAMKLSLKLRLAAEEIDAVTISLNRPPGNPGVLR